MRLTAVGAIPKPRRPRLPQLDGPPTDIRKGVRGVCFEPSGGYIPTPVYDRYKLLAGAVLEGPAIVEEFDSTVVAHPGDRLTVDEFASLHIVRGS